MIGAGASGFVLKRSAAVDLVGAIRHAVAGHTYVDPAVAGQIVTAMGQPGEGDGRLELSEREVAVIQQIAQGYANKQIASRLRLSVKTVETYEARAMEKLGVRSRVDIVKYAFERGWLVGD
jgi:DNA-binding NarL/FixJ family response regulator